MVRCCTYLQTCTNCEERSLALVVPAALLVCSRAQDLFRNWCMSEIFCNTRQDEEHGPSGCRSACDHAACNLHMPSDARHASLHQYIAGGQLPGFHMSSPGMPSCRGPKPALKHPTMCLKSSVAGWAREGKTQMRAPSGARIDANLFQAVLSRVADPPSIA